MQIEDNAPRVSVVMSVYNGIEYLREAVDSIIGQTFTDWEFIIVNEYGSNDGSAEIIKEYARADKRIRLLQNEERLGLAESLNVGIDCARGEYIARMDDDDVSYPQRLEKQVGFMDKHLDIGLCGTLQRSVTPNSATVLHVAVDPEELKAEMIFGCQISHCSVIFRRKLFLCNKWKYSKDRLGEDFDLWLRVMYETKIANINEVLVDHRWLSNNISIQKGERLHEESRVLISDMLRLRLNVDTEKYDTMLFSTWRNDIKSYAVSHSHRFAISGYELLSEIKKQNNKLNVFDVAALEKTLQKRWRWILHNACIMGFKGILEGIDAITVDVLPNIMQPIIHKGSKVVVYGLGLSCEKFFMDYSHISIDDLEFDIIAFCDKEKKSAKYNRVVISPDQLIKMKYDYILIASEVFFEEIKKDLMQLGVLEHKVLPIAAMYAAQSNVLI